MLLFLYCPASIPHFLTDKVQKSHLQVGQLLAEGRVEAQVCYPVAAHVQFFQLGEARQLLEHL